MIHSFGQFELDAARMELRSHGAPIAVEPQVFALLRLLVENRDRMVPKDEIIARVWDGRIVSDAAVASRVKSARQALGDDGRSQAMIRTVRGLGFVFVAQDAASPGSVRAAAPEQPAIADGRPRLCVLPFRQAGTADACLPIADALPYDLITELARLHWMFVIARASSFRFRGAAAQLANVRARLDVQYCLTGVIEIIGSRLVVSVELADVRSETVVWGERFTGVLDDVHDIRSEIVSAVVNAVEIRVRLNEARLAQHGASGNLDAWGAYHLGVHRMYRFNQADNAAATALFERAISLDPAFARAHAGLSFTYFQNAFVHYAGRDRARDLAFRHAEESIQLDPLDPFGHLVMGRSYWLDGDLDRGALWLERANALNPNYAQARYSRGLTQALLGNAGDSRADADAALALSPLDPLVYGMLGVKALSHIAEDRPAAAARWAEKAANAPGAHALIALIAAVSHGLDGNEAKARYWAGSGRARAPNLSRKDFIQSFPFRSDRTRRDVTGVLERLGF